MPNRRRRNSSRLARRVGLDGALFGMGLALPFTAAEIMASLATMSFSAARRSAYVIGVAFVLAFHGGRLAGALMPPLLFVESAAGPAREGVVVREAMLGISWPSLRRTVTGSAPSATGGTRNTPNGDCTE